MPLFGPPNIEKMKERGDSAGLIKVLSSEKSSRLRIDAVLALGYLRKPETVEPIIKALCDENINVAIACCEVLGEIGDKRAVEPLIYTTKNADSALLPNLIAALGKIGDIRAVDPLVSILKNRGDGINTCAAGALDQLNWVPNDVESQTCYWIAKKEWKKCIDLGYPAVEFLNRALGLNDREIRESIANTLGKIKDPRSIPALLLALKEEVDPNKYFPYPKGIKTAIVNFGQIAVETLINSLPNSSKEYQKAVISILGRIGGSQAINTLAALMSEKSAMIVRAAAEGLSKIGFPAVDALIEIVMNGNQTAVMEAVNALGVIRDPHAVRILSDVLTDKNRDVKVRAAAAGSLGQIGDGSSVDPLIHIWNDGEVEKDLRLPIIDALANIADIRSLDIFIKVIENGWSNYKESDLAINNAAKSGLIKIGSPSVSPLIEKLQKGRWNSRKLAAEALMAIYHLAGIDDLTKNQILKDRNTIIQPHLDKYYHSDGCPSKHEDTGVGLDFPL